MYRVRDTIKFIANRICDLLNFIIECFYTYNIYKLPIYTMKQKTEFVCIFTLTIGLQYFRHTYRKQSKPYP